VETVTYRELFNDWLVERISAGGDVGTIVMLVNVYQSQDSVARHYEFIDWLNAEPFSCALCKRIFKVTDNEIEENHHVLCPKCRKQN
jgi:hypothetical protein